MKTRIAAEAAPAREAAPRAEGPLRGAEPAFEDRRAEVVAQRRLRAFADASPRATQMKALTARVHESPRMTVQRALASAVPSQRVVQRITEKELKALGARMAEASKSAPETGMNLWVAANKEAGALVYLLGTAHGLRITQLAEWQALVSFLQSEPFTDVFSETTGEFDKREIGVPADAVDKVTSKIKVESSLTERFPGGEPKGAMQERKPYLLAKRGLDAAEAETGGIEKLGLDDAYVALAMSNRKKGAEPRRGLLESTESRAEAAATNVKDLDIDMDNARGKYAETIGRVSKREGETDSGTGDIQAGDAKAQIREQAGELLHGRDIANAEERNKQWMAKLKVKEGDRQLWIVGAAHLPGLTLRFQDLGWTVEHRGPLKGEEKKAASSDTGTGSASKAEEVD